MKKLLTIGLIIASIFFYSNARSDEYRIDSLTVEDGLSSDGVKSIFYCINIGVMNVSIMAAGTSRIKASIRYLRFCLRFGRSSFLFSLYIMANITIVPKLRAAASPMIRAGISKMP